MNISECSLLALKCQDRHTKILHQRALSHKLYLFLGRFKPQICKPMKAVCGLDVDKDRKNPNHKLISPNFLLAKKSPISPRIAVNCTV